MSKLYIAEKPSLGRAIASALPTPHTKGDGFIRAANGDIVTWCIGHLLEQVNPDAYDPHYHYQLAIDAGLSAYAAPIGMIEAGAGKFAGQVPTILKVNSSNSLARGGDAPSQAITGSVSEAIRLGCSAIGFTIYPGSDAAFDMIHEIRRQFRDIPGLLEGTAQPDTARCVDIATKAALDKMVLPGALAILAPVIVGFGIGPEALGGMLGGALITGVMMALMMANAGGAWDNAKKHVEKGNLGGKGSDVHTAVVVGDTVGDPLKDTSGPSMNILINVMAIVSLVIAPLLV